MAGEPIQIKSATVRIRRGPRGMAKALRGIMKEELPKVIRDWHQGTMPGHFDEQQAEEKYNYRTRASSYRKAKKSRFGHNNPLVWTGHSLKVAKRFIKTSGTSRRGRGRIPVPPYFGMGRLKWMKDEVVQVTQREAWQLAKNLNARVHKRLDRVIAIENKRII